MTFKNTLIEPLSPIGLWLKAAILSIVILSLKPQPTQPAWAVLMILLAAVVLVPIGYQQVMQRQADFKAFKNALFWQWFTAVLLTVSFLLEKNMLLTGALALPYAAWCATVFFYQIMPIFFKNKSQILRGHQRFFQLPFLTTLAAFGFLTNAAVWLVFDRFDYQPLGFSAWIVLLTGTHFHFAGFALTVSLALLLTENAAKNVSNRAASAASFAVFVGVVLTAAGITATQLGFGHRLETVAGVWMATAATLAGGVFIGSSFREKPTVRACWFVGGMCLTVGMSLAVLYALRPIFPIAALDLPTMQAVHGSLNALGFGTLMLVGWSLKE